MASYDKTVAEIIQPNSEDENGDFWDPWESLGLRCCSYNSEIDQQAIDVLREIGSPEFAYCTDIAERTGLSATHVELLQSIFCSADWCEYGTSPRGCWPIDREGFPKLVEAWEQYFERHWGERASGTPTRRAETTGSVAEGDGGPVAKPDAQGGQHDT
jgi:hypothetical protein